MVADCLLFRPLELRELVTVEASSFSSHDFVIQMVFFRKMAALHLDYYGRRIRCETP